MTGLDAKILALLAKRAPTATICPSDVARSVRPNGNWRALMPEVRAAAAALAREGLVEIRQRGKAVEPTGYVGPIRIALTAISKRSRRAKS